MKKRCSPQGIVCTIATIAALAVIIALLVYGSFLGGIDIAKEDVVIVRAAFSMVVIFLLLLAAAYVRLLKRSFHIAELSDEGVREGNDFIPWSEIGCIFILPEPPLDRAIVEKRICFARSKRYIYVNERLCILRAKDILSFPYSVEAEKYVRQHTDLAIDLSLCTRLPLHEMIKEEKEYLKANRR